MCHPWEELPIWTTGDATDDATDEGDEPEGGEGFRDVQREVGPS